MRMIRRGTLRDEMVEAIEEFLVSGDLKPGDRVNETELAQRVGISRGPVREAIQQLVGEGILISRPHQGTVVAEWSEKDIAEVYSLRGVLEGFATGLVAERATPDDVAALQRLVDQMRERGKLLDVKGVIRLDVEFHELLDTLADHTLLFRALSSVFRQIKFLLAVDLNANLTAPGVFEQYADNHQAFVDAIRTGDRAYAETRVREHMVQVGARLIQQLHESSDHERIRQPLELLV
jgi:DNA-binding GntR family transcriptional regulator